MVEIFLGSFYYYFRTARCSLGESRLFPIPVFRLPFGVKFKFGFLWLPFGVPGTAPGASWLMFILKLNQKTFYNSETEKSRDHWNWWFLSLIMKTHEINKLHSLNGKIGYEVQASYLAIIKYIGTLLLRKFQVRCMTKLFKSFFLLDDNSQMFLFGRW